MKTFPLKENAVVFHQDILDFRDSLLLCIYQDGDVFGFRFVKSLVGGKTIKVDPTNDSDKFNWAYGPYSSPSMAEDVGREFYLDYYRSKLVAK